MDHLTKEELTEYFAGRLKGAHFKKVDEHVHKCEECQDALASSQQLPPDPSKDKT